MKRPRIDDPCAESPDGHEFPDLAKEAPKLMFTDLAWTCLNCGWQCEREYDSTAPPEIDVSRARSQRELDKLAGTPLGDAFDRVAKVTDISDLRMRKIGEKKISSEQVRQSSMPPIPNSAIVIQPKGDDGKP